MILLCLHLAEEVCSNYKGVVLQQVWKLTYHHIFEVGYNISEKGCEVVKRIHLAQDRIQ